MTPILPAVGNHDLSSINLLLEYNSPLYLPGRVIRRREEFYFDPYELAVNRGFFDVVELLHAYGYNLSKYSYLTDPMSSRDIPATLRQDECSLKRLGQLASNPHSLFRITTIFIRSVLKKKLHDKIATLPLPPSIQSDLLNLAQVL